MNKALVRFVHFNCNSSRLKHPDIESNSHGITFPLAFSTDLRNKKSTGFGINTSSFSFNIDFAIQYKPFAALLTGRTKFGFTLEWCCVKYQYEIACLKSGNPSAGQ